MPFNLFKADILKPLYYFLELQVASRSIPNVSRISDRKRLSDHRFDGKASFDHGKWDAVLKRHVTVGAGTIGDVCGINMVDYAGVKEDEDFKSYLSQLHEAEPENLQPAEQLAFWMNAYNALCINIIIQYEETNNVKIASINDITTEGNPVWDQEAGKVSGRGISLNAIEHDMLRKKWDEPLIHACIVCASASCPNLRSEAFVPSRLNEQMNEQMRDWMKNDSKGLKLDGNRLMLSRIFLWFGADFGDWNGIREFLPIYLEDKITAKRITEDNMSVRYFDYGWQINRASKQ